jgi:glutamyl-tRNA synthetase
MNRDLRNKLRDEILRFALKNALDHDGKAAIGPVMSKIMGRHPEFRDKAREVVEIVKEVVKEVNSLTYSQQRRLAEEKYPDILIEEEKVEKKKELPPLPNFKKYNKIRTRFAPNPDFFIHLGNARPAILSSEYAKNYKGIMILRFEDTDPKTKTPMPEAYRSIREDLKWLGVKWDEEYIQSLRMRIYYDMARDLIVKGGAYVDLCSRDEFLQYKLSRKPCPHRESSSETNLELFEKMLSGDFNEGEAVLRVKTDISHPDPSVIDWVAFRIIDTSKTPHPIVGDKYIVWPTYNFAAAVDDYLLGVTHILRGKEHAVNTLKQKYLYRHMGWDYPEVINLGRLKLEGLILSKSKIKELLKLYPKLFSGPDDIRFGTIASLRNRGILPEAIKEVILEVGVKGTDATISWDNIAAINRKLIDPTAKRVMAVFNPVKLIINNIFEAVDELKIKIPYHPENKALGERVIDFTNSAMVEVYIERKDAEMLKKSGFIRLMEFCNVKYLSESKTGIEVEFIDRKLETAKKLKASIIHWVPGLPDVVEVILLQPEGLKLNKLRGIGEPALFELHPGERVQLIRLGFAKVTKLTKGKTKRIKLAYMHA